MACAREASMAHMLKDKRRPARHVRGVLVAEETEHRFLAVRSGIRPAVPGAGNATAISAVIVFASTALVRMARTSRSHPDGAPKIAPRGVLGAEAAGNVFGGRGAA